MHHTDVGRRFFGDGKSTRCYDLCVTTRARGPQGAEFKWSELAPEVQASVRAGLEQALRGESIALTPEELDLWAETGELPERVEQWVASSPSRRAT
jgi:hypothetical protein